MRLLIIEDEEPHRELVATALEHAVLTEFNWEFTETLAEAREALKGASYDLILADLSLPDSSFDETLPAILESASEIPVIVLTSLNDPQTILQMIRKGAKDCIPKVVLGSHVLERAIAYCIDRERLQAQLIEKERQHSREIVFKRLFDRSKVGFLICDVNGVIIESNPAYSEWLGYAQSELVNKSVFDLTDPEFREETRRNWEDLCELRAEEISIEKRCRHRDGSIRYGHVILQKIDWAPIGPAVLASVFDLSAYKKIEENLKEARDRAQSALAAKGALLSMMSHDIRAPIAGIVSTAGYLEETRLGEEERECIQAIRRSGNNMLQMIAEILEFSRLEAGKIQLHPSPTDIQKVVQDAIRVFAAQAEEKQIRIQTSFDLKHAKPSVDGGRLGQILSNLIGNAVKFTPKKGLVQIEVAQGKDSLRISVKDDGIGISTEDQKKLFKPFSQANEKIHAQYGGTGLGLSICREFCEAMGGHIRVESTEGVGSTFWVDIPTTNSD